MKTSQRDPASTGRKQGGFTLIELLVVIAIIGILSTVVLVSLNAARGRGSNAGIKTAFAQMRTQSNLYINDFGNFGTAAANGGAGSCSTANTVFVDATFAKIIASAQSAAGNGYTALCENTTGASGSWALDIHLNSPDGSNNYVCTDATGAIKYYAGVPSLAASVCP